MREQNLNALLNADSLDLSTNSDEISETLQSLNTLESLQNFCSKIQILKSKILSIK